MSPARKTTDVEEPDRVEGQPHPREVYDLIGQDDALARAGRSIRSGRPPHGLMRNGWHRNSLRQGHQGTVEGFRSKLSDKVANARTATLPDGRQVFAASSFDL